MSEIEMPGDDDLNRAATLMAEAGCAAADDGVPAMAIVAAMLRMARIAVIETAGPEGWVALLQAMILIEPGMPSSDGEVVH